MTSRSPGRPPGVPSPPRRVHAAGPRNGTPAARRAVPVAQPSRRHADGRAAEDLAARHLEAQGLAIAARNLRTRRGEIDLVVRDGDTLVFVEVRLRRPGRHGDAAASVTARKRARIVAAAEDHLAELAEVPACRFDVVVLDALDPGRIEWLRGAFDAGDER